MIKEACTKTRNSFHRSTTSSCSFIWIHDLCCNYHTSHQKNKIKKKKKKNPVPITSCLHYLILWSLTSTRICFPLFWRSIPFFLIATMATHCYTDKKHIGNGYNIFVPEIQQVTGHDQLFVTALLILGL